MKIAGIVAEYNPFHNGHLYQITKVKEELGVDKIIAVMSGNFSQRGLPTICDKFTRTRMALNNGVDLVIELPVMYAAASAEFFSKYAVSILNSLGIVDYIAFGSECGDIDILTNIASTTFYNKSKLDKLINEYTKSHLSYTEAICKATITLMSNYDSNIISDVIKSSNNILALEYIKALLYHKSNITPYTIKRSSSNFNDTHIYNNMPSATAIRHSLYSGNVSSLQATLPHNNLEIIKNYSLPNLDKLTQFVHYKFIFSNIDKLYTCWDVSNDLINTIVKYSKEFASYDEIVNFSTSKSYTRATVSRTILKELLDITANDTIIGDDIFKAKYIRVLGVNKNSTNLLKLIKQNSNIPLITNFGKDYKIQNSSAKALLDYEINASKLYSYLIGHVDMQNMDYTTAFIRN